MIDLNVIEILESEYKLELTILRNSAKGVNYEC